MAGSFASCSASMAAGSSAMGRGDHDICRSPLTTKPFTVPAKIDSRHTANKIPKDAGITEGLLMGPYVVPAEVSLHKRRSVSSRPQDAGQLVVSVFAPRKSITKPCRVRTSRNTAVSQVAQRKIEPIAPP